jgi:hypothetical protein
MCLSIGLPESGGSGPSDDVGSLDPRDLYLSVQSRFVANALWCYRLGFAGGIAARVEVLLHGAKVAPPEECVEQQQDKRKESGREIRQKV